MDVLPQVGRCHRIGIAEYAVERNDASKRYVDDAMLPKGPVTQHGHGSIQPLLADIAGDAQTCPLLKA